MAFDVLLGATLHELQGDETYELWLKHESGPWQLEASAPVTVEEGEVEEIWVYSLVEGDHYSAQFRLKRNGRYRAGYLTASPDTWPASSLANFVPGEAVGVGAPTINSATWSRTSSVSQQIALALTLADGTKYTRVYRDDELLTTLDPGVTSYVDLNPDIAENHTYQARHATSGGLTGPFSDPLQCFAGPLPPDAAQASPTDDFGYYDITFDGVDPVDIGDDFLCAETFTVQIAGTTSAPYRREIEDSHAPDDPDNILHASFHARVRKTVTSFTIDDVSDWFRVPIECDIEPDNPDYNSCP